MKAVILAGGEGVRLRPITARRPKPMVDLVGQPVLAHTVALLKRAGVREICITLGYLPEVVLARFSDGSPYGVQIETRIERRPLGTAGAVRACADFLGEDDFFVVSGDAVCDFDLKAIAAAHRAAHAQASLALYSHDRPLEYGLVVTGKDGRVVRFVEKPGWEGVCTDLVNTGIYVCTPEVLRRIPEETAVDFARDVFPGMLADGAPLYGFQAKGYWCDIGCPEEYLRCCTDVLDGRTKLRPVQPQLSKGVWAGSDLHGAEITPPVFVDRNVFVARGAKLGPGAILCAGSSVAPGACIRRSVVDGAAVRGGADVDGAVLCPGAVVGADTRVEPGCVIGENTHVGSRSLVAGRARLWPDLELEPGAKITEDVHGGRAAGASALFTARGVISGAFGTALTPEGFVRLGTAAAGDSPVVLASSGGEAAGVLRSAFSSGVRAGGGTVIQADCGCAASLRHAVRALGGGLGLWLQQHGGDVQARFYTAGGTTLNRLQERKLESAASAGAPRPDGRMAGAETYAAGMDMLYAAAAAAMLEGAAAPAASVFGSGAENRILRRALERAGVYSCTAAVHLTAMDGGLALQAVTESGRTLPPPRLLACALLAELDTGVRTAAVPASAPAVLDRIAGAFGGRILRPGVEEFDALRRAQPWFFDGVCLAVRLCSHLTAGHTLDALDARVPAFGQVRHEVRLAGSERGRVMRALAQADNRLTPAPGGGLTASTAAGFIRVEPSRAARALVFYGESTTMEAAAELCAPFERQARTLDGGLNRA